MQVSVTTTEGLQRQMKVAVPAEQIEKEVHSRLQSLGRRARIKGFRPGKAPFKIIERDYGAAVRNEVVGDVIQSSFVEAIANEKLRPVGRPRIDETSAEPGQELTYTAVFEVYPTLDSLHCEGFTLEKLTAQIGDSDIDEVIERMRNQRKEWHAVEREAANGDRIRIDFVGTLDGEAFAGNEAKDYPLQLGAGTMIAGFEEPLVGARAGDKRAVDITFPEDYAEKTLAGKPAHFEVTVNTVEEGVLPALDANFVERMGIGDGSIETLRAEVRNNMQRELEVALKAKSKKRVFDALVEANPFDLPKALVDQEIDNALARAQQRAAQRGQTSTLARNDLRAEAERRVRLGILIAEIALKNDIKVSQKEIREFVEAEAAVYENPEQAVRWMLADKARIGGIESLVLENKVVDFVLEKANTEDKAVSFDEVMQGRN